MTESAIGPDIHQSLDRHRDLAPPGALHLELVLDHLAELGHFLLGEVLHARVGIHTGHANDPDGVESPIPKM
jgi:hypothetical protein